MKASQFFISTLKGSAGGRRSGQPPTHDARGLIKKLGAGVYSYMPMGLRVIQKVRSHRAGEMNRAGAVELTMPVVQPAELWQGTARFDSMGPELLRIKDRHGRIMLFSPPVRGSGH